MLYYNEIKDDSRHILSCDGVRINFTISENTKDDFVSFFNSPRIDIKEYPLTYSEFKYKYLWQTLYQVGSDMFSMTIGFCFNGVNSVVDSMKGYLDFNPNKLGSNRQFWVDFDYIKRCSDDWSIARVDIALDIPSKRENVFLVKDSRKYAIDAYSISNKTEYLGRRSNVGYVKVYNKTEESKLSYDLTRIEVTCEPTLESYQAHFPRVYDLSQNPQLSMDMLNLPDTDLTILRMEWKLLSLGADEGLMLFNSLSLHKKQKLAKFLLPESCLVDVLNFVSSSAKVFSSLLQPYMKL